MTRQCVVAVAAVLTVAGPARAASPCSRVVQGPPRYHHVLALDTSGSVLRHLQAMKRLLACYAEMYALPGEEITLVAFARDERASVKDLSTFTVPPHGSSAVLNSLLDEIEVLHPRRTRTYFRPLAQHLERLLTRVRLEPTILLVSDGRSDAFRDPEVASREIPFEQFGKRGIFAVPGVRNWKVAVMGGHGLPLTELFKKPLRVRAPRPSAPARPLGPVVDPCLIDPVLVVETDPVVAFQRPFSPLAREVRGQLGVKVRNDCVSRFRSFTVTLTRGNDTQVVARVRNTLVGKSPRRFSFPVTVPVEVRKAEAVVGVTLEQGASRQAVYATPGVVQLRVVPYWSSHGWRWGAIAGGLLVALVALGWALRRRSDQEQHRPEVVKVLGSEGVALARDQAVSMGGEGCTVALPGVPARLTCAVAEWSGTRGRIRLRGQNGHLIRVGYGEPVSEADYELGRPLELVDPATGTSYPATVYPSQAAEIGLGSITAQADDPLASLLSGDSGLGGGNGASTGHLI